MYIGEGLVCHYDSNVQKWLGQQVPSLVGAPASAAAGNDAAELPRIQVVTLAQFTNDGQLPVTIVRRCPSEADGERIKARALSKVGETQYDLLKNNCDHFACWATEGEARSDQV